MLPKGLPLPEDSWDRRHRAIVVLLWLHVLAVGVVGIGLRQAAAHVVAELAAVAAFAAVASQAQWRVRRLRAISSVLGLVTSSALLVHMSGGMTEIHFHFFVMIAVVALYQDWAVLLSAILFVSIHHGAVGAVFPRELYGDAMAHHNPWALAGLHAGFVVAASVVHVISWRFHEAEYIRAESSIRQREGRFRSLIENASDGITVLSAEGKILYDSPSVPRVIGYQAGSRRGSSAFDYIVEEDRAGATVLFNELLSSGPGATAATELRVIHADGSSRWVEVRASNMLDQPDLRGIVVNFRDTTDRKKLESDLAHQAFHDPLTKLANRALFLDRINHAQAAQKRNARALAVIFLDLDDFKNVNDGLGHAAGDRVLTTVAERLQSCVREGDTCARLGGDEFGILLEGLDNPAEAYELGARLIVAMAETLVIDGKPLTLSASMGIVVSVGEDDPASLLRYADLAMYEAKSGGKNRYEIFEAGMYETAMDRLQLRSDLRRGIEAGDFVAHYQPIVNLESGEILGAEALVRWNHPTRGLLPPAEFLDLAEETGLIVDIGRAVLTQACRDAVRWFSSTALDLTVSVNLSARQLQDPNLVDDVRRALKESGLDPRSLTLEVTESVLIEDPDSATERLGELKDLGVSIALDDFGTGFSSLSYLRRFPVDRLKIDKSFVDALTGGAASDSSLVSAITGLGISLDLAVTAEGIEECVQVDALLALGCRTGQGFYFARPITNDDFNQLLDDRRGSFNAVPTAALLS